MLTLPKGVERVRAARPRLPIGRGTVDFGKNVNAPEGRKVRVLLIEDDESVSESTRRLLRLEDFRVDCAFDGKSGVARAQSGSYDVIVLDRMLPDLSGDEVLERLRTTGNATPVLILTGFPDYPSALHAGRFNVSDYLVKSAITGADLTASIRKATARAVIPDTRMVETKTRLFSAYEGKPTRPFGELTAYLRTDDIDPAGLSCALARVISARDLTFVEFLAASKSLHLLNRKAHLPFHVALSTLRDWLDPALVARPLDSWLEELLDRLEAAGKEWPRISAADCAGVDNRDQPPSDRSTDPANPTFHQSRRAVVMRCAVLELLKPHEQIRQIAHGLGYSDHGNFDHDFFRFFGVTPKQFRRLV